MSNFLTTIRKALATLAALALATFLLTSCGGGGGGNGNGNGGPGPRCPNPADTYPNCMRIIPDPNRAPVAIGVIPEQTVTVGQSKTINLAEYFRDPDGDTLTYSLNYSRTSADQRGNVRATISGASLRIEGVASPGQTVIVVIVVATDPDKLSAQLQVGLRVQAATSQNGNDNGGSGQPNRAPQAKGTIPNQTVRVGQTAAIDVSPYFTDPDDDDRLAYSLVVNTESLVRATVSDAGRLQITGLASPGPQLASITVYATDRSDAYASQDIRITVQSDNGGQANRSPRTQRLIANQTVSVGQTKSIDLSDYFTDPDGDRLTYSLTFRSGSANQVRATVSGNTLRITGVASPGATIRVTAEDSSDGTASQDFRVTVSAPASPSRYLGWAVGVSETRSPSWATRPGSTATEAERNALNGCTQNLGSTCRGWDTGDASGAFTSGCIAFAVAERRNGARAYAYATGSTREGVTRNAIAGCERNTSSSNRGTCRIQTDRDGDESVYCVGGE